MTCCLCCMESPYARDGFCPGCRLRMLAKKSCKYPWTEVMDEELRLAYRTAKNKTALSKYLTSIASRHRRPRYIVQNRAQHLGLRIRVQREWTEDELHLLREYVGVRSFTMMGKQLGRTPAAVKHKCFALDLQGRVTEGYSQNELGKLFGVHHNKVGQWLAKGWLWLDEGRIPHEAVAVFARRHMDAYRFAACVEWWLKTLLNPQLGRKEAA